MALLEVNNLNVRFPTEDGVVHAVRNVSFTVDRGEVLGVVGESGSGKSVTNLAMMGLLPRSTRIDGSIKYDGAELVGLPRKRQTKYRGNELGMIFQDPMTSLNPVYTVGWQIAEAVRAHQDVPRKAAKQRAVELLELVGIPQASKRVDSYPHEFSGGMRQRVMIAMSMANNPQVLIADEPTTALDVTVQAQILETLIDIQQRTNIAIILITHDLGVVAGMADRVLVMYAGAAVEVGTVDEIFYRPRMPYTIGLLGAIPSEASDGQKLRQIKGATPSLIQMKPGCAFSSRCPLAFDRCLTETPVLEATDDEGHLAACHLRNELDPVSVRALFSPELITEVGA
ncbi:MAG: ABC transporter ATP-binding protein [Ilumatobacteraceae bacterium]|jgi:oligopeptide/dipeptide ABC transporter ATP-binding protein|nr:ABC transporter ATP-binding protein [Acidimicrobiaceae bacterium]MBP6486287.1 ABC transporter ATP-binding protein [Ilumatobacteraceae bacterium]MBP7887615.1 ABC transporter ATP-binding protein [Ilumatobacteraceae bacterium]MBP8207991.1 ABC transporter ATP-binding protein [Ilumatobacteraceae bacterium]